MPSRSKKYIFTSITLLSLIGYGVFVFAAAPSGGYDPGDTLDPDCAPGDTDCLVNIPGPINGLETIGSDFGLGGSLIQDTVIDQDGKDFSVSLTDSLFGFPLEMRLVNSFSAPSPLTFDPSEVPDGSLVGSEYRVTNGVDGLLSFVGIAPWSEHFDGNADPFPLPTMSFLSTDSGGDVKNLSQIVPVEGWTISSSRTTMAGSFGSPDHYGSLRVDDDSVSTGVRDETTGQIADMWLNVNGLNFHFDDGLGTTATYSLPTTDGTVGQVLTSNGGGQLQWTTPSGGSPAGSDGQVQYNNNGVFGADSLFTRDPSTFNTYIGKDIETPLYEYVIDLGYRVSDHPLTGTFVEGETIVGDTSGATAVIQRIDSPVLMMSVTGTFQDGETVTGQTSAATAQYDYFPGIQTGDTIVILDIDANTSVGFGTVTNTTSTQATIETIAAVQNGNYMGTIVNGTFTNAVNTIANIISQNEIDIIDGDTGISIGNTVDVLGGIFTGTGSSLSSSFAPGLEAQVFLGSLGVGNDNSFSISSINEDTDFATSILGYTTTIGSAGLQISTGTLTNADQGASISLNASNDASDIIFTTGSDGNQIAFFNQDGSIALGYNATATGIDSLAFGQYAYTHGDSGIALGHGALTWSAFETSIGSRTTQYTPVSSSLWDISDRLFAIGNGDQDLLTDHNAYTLWKDGSFAYNDDNFQNDNSGTEQNMFYFNYGNHDGLGSAQTKRAIRLGSVLNGEWDITSSDVGDRSIAFGFDNGGTAPIASGLLSIAFGDTVTASGENSIVFGLESEAEGDYSIAFGSSNTASGNMSTAFGLGNGAYSFGEISLGLYGSNYVANNTISSNNGDRLFNIGNGTAPGSEADAFTILKSGFTGIGYNNFETTGVTDLLQVNGDILSSSITGSCALESDADGTIICAASDERLKKNIEDLSYGLNEILQIRPVGYDFKNAARFGSDHKIGFLAQELQNIIPEMVTDGGDYLSVNYATLTPVLVKAIQEMNLKITTIDDLATENTWRDALIAWLGNATNGISDLFVKKIHTDELCVGTVCVTQEQFLRMVENSDEVPGGNGDIPLPDVPPVTPDDGGGTPPDNVPDDVLDTPPTPETSAVDSTETPENNDSSGDDGSSDPVL